MAKILPVTVVGWEGMHDHWWQWVLIGIILATVSVGVVYILYSVITRIIQRFQSRAPPDHIPKVIEARFTALSHEISPIARSLPSKKKHSSFGVHLGSFHSPPTKEEARILSQWDILIVDPVQPGVVEAVHQAGGLDVLARVDLDTFCTKNDTPLESINKLAQVISQVHGHGCFVGVLLVGWEGRFTASVLRGCFDFIDMVGLSVYLETSGPDFLKDGKVLQTDSVSGLAIRNASIMPNGEKRDYFQLTNMLPTIKAFVSEACLRDFTVMAWETVDDDVVIPNAVIKRGMQWCSFYSAITWIGSTSSLTDAALNTRAFEPLGAFGWLKEADVMKFHDIWRFNQKILRNPVDNAAWDSLQELFPSLSDALRSITPGKITNKSASLTLRDPPDWVSQVKSMGSPLSISPSGLDYSLLGCFPLGFDASPIAFAEIVQSQNRLKGLGLLHPVNATKLQNMGSLLKRFHETFLLSHWSNSSQVIAAVKELATLASNNFLRVNLGLDSGFRKNAEIRFWSVYHTDVDGLEIFVSKNAQGLAGTVLHTFLSSKGFPRQVCLEVETALASWSQDLVENTNLPRRLVQDIDVLTPEERLLLFQHLTLTDAKNDLTEAICAYIRLQLIDGPSASQLKELNTVGYLNGTVSPEELIKSRIVWYQEQGCQHPAPAEATALFLEVDYTFNQILRDRREDLLTSFNKDLSGLLKKGQIDAYADIVALSAFCAARKFAFDEVYAEVTDRNPLFNNQSDQAAAFAESFALGSRCESYFDVSPSVFGKLLSDRFRAYYNQHQPPSWINGAPALATSYSGAQIDVNPDDKVKEMPGYQRFTFLSVFAIPALVDIILLTITGRGLYLSAFMTLPEMESATTALMISLLMSGAIGTWISCGGSYYLISTAFSAMNMFILIRLIAGFAFTLFGGVIGFIVMSAVKGPGPGIVFFLYLMALTAYLTLFASIACFTFPGTAFLSGRKVIIFCIPLLVISPIITMFTEHDTVVYLAVIYVFIACLILGLRSVGSHWVTWYQNIRKTNDTEIKKWYVSSRAGDDEKVFGNMSDPAALKLAREALYDDVMAEKNRSFFSKATADKLVSELARDWDSTNFLLDWYCRYSDVPRPIPYSSSWNIQTKVGLDTLQNAQKGIRLHSAFIHWRQAGDEVGCGVLYFLVALLDKWVELVSGGQLVGLSASLSDARRMAVGFGLAYYLIGAVLIDTKSAHLHTLASRVTPTAVKSAREIRENLKKDVREKRKIYWSTLFKFLMWHVWSLAFTASLVWTFQKSVEAMVTFFVYVLAYSGLLWYQYTKIFSGPHALKPLLTAVIVGLPVGIALKVTQPHFLYSSVIGLGVSTWTAAILTLWTAEMGMPKKVDSPVELGMSFHAYTAPWSDPEWSQQELQTFWENMSSLPSDARFRVYSDVHPGVEVKTIIRGFRDEPRFNEAYPDARRLVDWSIEAWEKGNVTMELVPIDKLGPGIRALSCATEGHLKLAIGVGRGLDQRMDIGSNCQIIAETLLHAVAEALSQIPHEYARLAESLVASGLTENMAVQLQEEADTALVMRWAQRELLKQLCLGFHCDTDWDRLPKEIRAALIDRCVGKTSNVSSREWEWLQASLCRFDTKDLNVHVARCNLGAAMAVSVLDDLQYGTGEIAAAKEPETPDHIAHAPSSLMWIKAPFSLVYHGLGIGFKYFIIAMVADPEFQREFEQVMSQTSPILRIPTVFVLNLVWQYAKFMQEICLSLFLFHGRPNVKALWDEARGMTITLKRKRILITGFDGTMTSFKHDEPNGGYKIFQYKGSHKSEPEGTKSLKSISTYSKEMHLLSREDYNGGKLTDEYHYDYETLAKRGLRLSKGYNLRIPLGRRCVRGKNEGQAIQYNKKGLIEAGSYTRDGNLIRFKYHYRKNTRFGDELLRAEFVMRHMTCTVSWCVPPKRHPEKIERWIPHSKVTEATFVQGPDVYESKWLYDHKFHPTIFTTLNGQKVQTPQMIEFDWLAVLVKPMDTGFIHDNPLFYCDSLNANFVTRWLNLNRQRFPVSTSRSRSMLWSAWKSRVDFDGVIVRWLDEKLLRRNKVLKPYWRSRDRGNLAAAKKYLDLRADAVMASADMDDNISSWTPLAVKISDLFNFGPGGDAVVHTRSKEVGFDTNKTLHVMAADNGTWPNEGGGVSACRRDMINSLRSIKWHMICESANDFGTPKHQTEQNVQSLKVIPLWGLDFLTPTHGLFKNRLDSEVDNIATAATDLDIRRNFIPTLTALVKGARAVTLSNADILQATRALVNLNTYFQDSRHWGQVWTSDVVKESWRELWLTQEMSNATPSSEWFDTELPTLGHLETALDLWFRYLFIFSIPVPEKVPAVFQASHHSVSASYGIVCKIKRKCTLQIWDHAISWRETNLCLSSALCKLPPFVRNSLLGLMRMTSVLILHHADIILPCADFFNPGWEVEIGTCQGTIEHRNSFKRKIDPVVNGITDMQKFSPVKEIKAERPTVTMLSHVWYAKDIKIALIAADIIVNEWGFQDYHLDIYGAIDKAPTYSTECQEIIASKGLRGKATLRGTANPTMVLENTWLFLNSSLSEGLPLALGEAALTGAPVVCTDVGASLRVLSDPDDFSRFSAVVAPNDARALARAQINLLAMLGEWSKYAEDTEPAPALSSSPTPEEVAQITQRMYDKSEHRRKLGMMTRNIVQKSFSGERYLREHEQMLWIGKARKLMASRAAGAPTDPQDIPSALEQTQPVDEEVITIPRSAVHSWRSSAASGMSSAFTTLSNFPMLDSPKRMRPDSIQSNLSNASTEADSSLRLPTHYSLPIFAPGAGSARNSGTGLYSPTGRLSPTNRQSRQSRPMSPAADRRSRSYSRNLSPAGRDLLRGLQREELRQYRNSDVSMVMREEFLNSTYHQGNDTP